MSILSNIFNLCTERAVRGQQTNKKGLLWLRWTLFSCLLALGAASPGEIPDLFLVYSILVGLFIINIVVSFLPPRTLGAAPLEFSLGLLDTAVITYLFYRSDPSGYLCLFFFTLLITTALSTRIPQTLLSAFVLSASYLLLDGIRSGASDLLAVPDLLILPLFYSTALSFGYQVMRIREQHNQVIRIVRERQELREVLEILQSITSSLDFHSVMFQIASRIAKVIDAVRCSVLLVEDVSSRKAFVVAANDNRNLNMLPVDLDKYPEVHLAIESREPVIIEDIEKDRLLRPYLQNLLRLNFRSILVLPIIFRETVIGTLFLRASKCRKFTEDELKFCKVVASASASGIKNSMLHRKLQERAQAQEETALRFRTLFDNSPDLILQLDAKGIVQEMNRAAERSCQRTREEILGTPVSLLIEGLPPLPTLMESSLGKCVPPTFAATLLARGGGRRQLSVTAGSLGDSNRGLILIARDVTEQREANQMLQQREKLSSIGEIVAGVAHELNNPLTGVLGFSQLLAHKDTEGRFKRDIERIVECSNRCQKIVQNLLSFARPAHPEKKPLGLNGVLEKTLDLFEHGLQVDNIEVVRELEPDLPFVLADFHQIQQVLTNLITNALHALVQVERPGRLLLRTYLEDDRAALEVTDNGPGIGAETLPRIFDPFYSTKKQGSGTGLGLSVSYGIVREHNGELLVQSEVGTGTTFRVLLPVHGKQPQEEGEQASSPAAGAGKRILVVDDEEVIIELYLHLLKALGHSVDTASTGAEALKKIEADEYDLVITDIKMPKMSGIQLYEKAAAARPAMRNRFIFITGDMSSLSQKQYSTINDSPCLLKPVNIGKIEATIREVLSGQGSALDGPIPLN